MSIEEIINNDLGAGSDCYQLGIIASSTGRNGEAENWCKRAIEACHRAKDIYHEAMCLNALASLYLSRNRLDESEAYARRAFAIVETLDLSSEPWKVYSLLAQLAEKRAVEDPAHSAGRMDEVREWRRKEQESFAAFAGSDTQMKQYEPLIAAIVQAANGDEKVKAYLESQYPNMKAGSPDWAETANAIQLIVAGERDSEKLLSGAESQSGLVIRRVLQALNGEQMVDGGQQTEENGQLSKVNGQPQEQQGVTLPQLLELAERAAGGNKELGEQLFNAFQQMARNDDPAMSALGNVLLRVLVGEREPSLDGLPDEVASAVRECWGDSKTGSASHHVKRDHSTDWISRLAG